MVVSLPGNEGCHPHTLCGDLICLWLKQLTDVLWLVKWCQELWSMVRSLWGMACKNVIFVTNTCKVGNQWLEHECTNHWYGSRNVNSQSQLCSTESVGVTPVPLLWSEVSTLWTVQPPHTLWQCEYETRVGWTLFSKADLHTSVLYLVL